LKNFLLTWAIRQLDIRSKEKKIINAIRLRIASGQHPQNNQGIQEGTIFLLTMGK